MLSKFVPGAASSDTNDDGMTSEAIRVIVTSTLKKKIQAIEVVMFSKQNPRETVWDKLELDCDTARHQLKFKFCKSKASV